MKVVFVAVAIVGRQPGISGGETRFLEIARGFAARGYQIHLLSSLGAQHLLKKFGVKGKLHIISRNPSIARIVFWFRLLQSMFALPHSVKQERFDIIYASSEQSYDVIAAIKLHRRNPGSKLAVVVHWLPPSPPWKRSGSSFFNSVFFWLSERLGLWLAEKYADILLPVSEATASQLRQVHINTDRYAVVECGVNYQQISRFRKQIHSRPYDAVFMKRIQRSKGIFDLIIAWKSVVKRLPKAKLIVMGEGIDRQPAEEMVRKYGLEQNIEFLGVVYDFKRKFSLLAQSKLFVLPTHEENWAIVIGEAMAAGTPVVSYGLPELKAVWGDACQWVKPLDVEAFASAMEMLLTDKTAWQSLYSRALEYVKRYDWQAIAKKEVQIIESVKK